MDMRQLRYFLAIAHEGQITRAAKQLNMEQPPLSRQLKLIEQELGVVLFDRNGKRLQLTQAGEMLRDRALALMKQFEDTITYVQELGEGVQGVLSIGAVVSCVSLLPPVLRRFTEKYPQVTFKIQEGDHFLLGELLENRDLEFIVTRLPFQSDFQSQHYSALPLPSDPFVALLPTEWRPPDRRAMTMAELARFPFLTLKTDRTTGMHNQVFQQFKQLGLEPRIVSECSSVAIAISLVAAGIGAAILPKSVMNSFEPPSITLIEIEDARFHSDIGVVWLRDRHLSKSARHLMDMLVEQS
ncbi:LysR family transcriptional regulator [Cohnella sp. CIP 111063]|jgi:Transcriptional regulator|uniref:LysR family transcriptional regulator n=1 Tax=unclassified Cohnella TaxID=2636738 RepID=UPI000B8C1CB5|nr:MULTISPECIES: LysR family transcriptional regulator [unclassified Cohnella]OXS57612.1 LysR family transcriptional regulator [Cohnella sp. CIP 111063]PRX70991.1 DNA-binding transcriptional LysR family regulator [Cohnella sp. SGD-V74]